MAPFERQISARGVRARAASVGPPSNGSPQLVKDVQRLWIISAMAKITCEQGADSATIAQIVARAGVSKRTFHELFEDREACFLQTFDEAVGLAAERVAAAYEAKLSWAGRVRAAMLALLTFFDEEPEFARVCVVHSLEAGPQMLARRREMLEKLTKVIDKGRPAARAGTQLEPLIAEVLVGGVLAVIYARLESNTKRLVDLLNPLMFVIVLAYLGVGAARRELSRPVPQITPARAKPAGARDPLKDLDMRLTYRTLRVLAALASAPGISNREVADAAGIKDQGQISKLLARVGRQGLVHNTVQGQLKGEPNAWILTSRGAEVEQATGIGNRHMDWK